MIPYFVLIALFCVLSEIKWRGHYPLRIAALLLLILFIGLRNEVGTDYNSYRYIFNLTGYIDMDDIYIEPGWFLLNKFVLGYTSEFKVITLIHAAMLVSLLHLALKDFKYYTFAFVLFILLEHGYIFIVNGMRQGLALAVFFYSWRFISSREALKYWACILLAATVHMSILFISPVYWLANRTYSYRFYLIVQFATLILYFTHLTDNLLLRLMSFSSYANYLDTQFAAEAATNSGIKYLALRLCSVFVILYYGKLLKKYPQYLVPFNMFFFSLVAGDLFVNIRILARMNLYFCWSSYMVIPLFLAAVFKREPSRRIAQSFVLAAVALFFLYRAYTDLPNNLFYTF